MTDNSPLYIFIPAGEIFAATVVNISADKDNLPTFIIKRLCLNDFHTYYIFNDTGCSVTNSVIGHYGHNGTYVTQSVSIGEDKQTVVGKLST